MFQMTTKTLACAGLLALSILPACGDKGSDESSTTSSSEAGEGEEGETSEATTSSTTTTSSSSTTAGFVGDSMSGPAMCDPKPIDDCPDGQKCTWDASGPTGDQNICVDLMGDGEIGDECMNLGTSDTCGLHKICWGVDAETMLGTCIEFCDETDQCPENAPCTITNDGTLRLCLPPCDPLVPSCPAGWACYDDPSLAWFCDLDVSGEGGQHGTPCEFINACDPGSICVDATVVNSSECQNGASSGCCANVCSLSENPTCPNAGEVCTSYYEGMTPPPGFSDVGICILPQ